MKPLTNAAAVVLALLISAGTTFAQNGPDDLTKARLAAVEGDHVTCAKLADKARRQPNTVWQAHQVFASCQAYVMEAKREKIPAADYISGLSQSVDALQFLLETPGLVNNNEQRASIMFVIEEFERRIQSARG
ncbi:MAG: hypothetical protein RIC14_17220 [Filomicrobium sp.]